MDVIEEIQKQEEEYRDSIATVDKDGKRIWIYPKMPKGKFYDYRKWVSYILLVVLFGLPWIKIGGEPFVLFNVIDRKFIIFGIHFGLQDFHLFVIGMIILILFIVLFTVVFGRLFCGWVCPQTIFMEMVYRRLEYWIEGDANAQRRLNKAPWTMDKVWKKGLKQALFFGIAVLIANTFLAYIIGMDEVMKIMGEPIIEHNTGFIAMIIFSVVFYLVFAQLREQVCTTICPYGRLQGVMLDKNSLAVYYDFERGEPRGKMKKKVNPDAPKLGDCIDCKLCVQVCPTGIDIRNGIQLECVNCTACMDACDEVMEKIDRPKGLVRMDSYNGIVNKEHKLFNTRTIAYSAVLLVLIGLESFLFISRSDVETLLLRTPGMLYQEPEEGIISNLYNYQLINKTSDEYEVRMELMNIEGSIEYIGQDPKTIKNEVSEGALFIKIPKEQLQGRKNKIKINVYNGDKLVDEVTTNFLGPIK
ncbi:MAG: cytochrome c oxidase accessory protein CcoG [Saprospiraceae bacterium]|nr:cytochrome c oxidase accessory protein CcoG [Saprospiraceae bacterium]